MNIQKTFDEEEQHNRILPKIRCEICGREFRQITYTHLKTHDITPDEYKKQFPDPLLVSDALKRKILERIKQIENIDINAILKYECEQDICNKKELKATIKQEYIDFVKRCKKGAKIYRDRRKREFGFHPISLLHDGCIWHHVNKNDVVACPSYIHTHVGHKCGDGKIEGILG